ncbi:MAG TPA: hypothetical protein PLP66_14680, partial [Phycisphaerae bacterium]|nr:hypothetical protein [Phycisphaerae bacterium]
MAARYARLALLVGLLLAPVWAVAGDETLATAYAAILRGDYDAGRATIERLATTEHDAAAGRVQNWLEDYHKVVASRKELKAKTFEWNIEQAQKALADAKPFVALNFVAQAVPYAPEGDNLT